MRNFPTKPRISHPAPTAAPIAVIVPAAALLEIVTDIYSLTIKTRLLFVCVCVYIYIYICNELIEETAGHRKLIFGMWGSFGYGSSKLSTYHGIMTSLAHFKKS